MSTPLQLDEQTIDTDSPAILKGLIQAHQPLAELKGIAKSIPNHEILLSTLTLQEAKDSSEIENIITTQDALYKYRLSHGTSNLATKEVANYAAGLAIGFEAVQKQGCLSLNTLLEIQAVLESNRAGFRKLPGTVLRNEQTGEVVYTPPAPQTIPASMNRLEALINQPAEHPIDPLVLMAIIHHRFESIHPFYDGNGRTGRILNILYLVKEGLLDAPILYLSRYINHTKEEYYQKLQQVRSQNDWEGWILYLLKGVELTARQTITLIEAIKALLQKQKHDIRDHFKFYSQDLINNIFRNPYTKVQFVEHDLKVSRATATRYLNALAQHGILEKHKLGRENYYLNHDLVKLLFNIPTLHPQGK